MTLLARRPGWGRQAAFIVGGAVLAVAAASLLGAWANRLGTYRHSGHVVSLVREIAWFTWPTWPLALFTVWKWRRRLLDEHLAMPLGCTLTLLAVWIGMGGSSRALMLALPSLAVLAAFALPTLQRSAAAAIDWFSVFFFTIAAATGWAFYVAMQTGEPAKLAANVAKLSPGFQNTFSPIALAFALAATVAWAWLVKWRTGRNRHPIWKSMVLPAGGVTLSLVLVMTVLLPPFDNARSYRSMVQRVARQISQPNCISAPGMSRAQIVALEYQGGWRVDAVTPPGKSKCEILILPRQQQAAGCLVAVHGPGTPGAQRRRRRRHLPARRPGALSRPALAIAAVDGRGAGFDVGLRPPAPAARRAPGPPGRSGGRSRPCRARSSRRARRHDAAPRA